MVEQIQPSKRDASSLLFFFGSFSLSVYATSRLFTFLPCLLSSSLSLSWSIYSSPSHHLFLPLFPSPISPPPFRTLALLPYGLPSSSPSLFRFHPHSPQSIHQILAILNLFKNYSLHIEIENDTPCLNISLPLPLPSNTFPGHSSRWRDAGGERIGGGRGDDVEGHASIAVAAGAHPPTVVAPTPGHSKSCLAAAAQPNIAADLDKYPARGRRGSSGRGKLGSTYPAGPETTAAAATAAAAAAAGTALGRATRRRRGTASGDNIALDRPRNVGCSRLARHRRTAGGIGASQGRSVLRRNP